VDLKLSHADRIAVYFSDIVLARAGHITAYAPEDKDQHDGAEENFYDPGLFAFPHEIEHEKSTLVFS
jgi:hypothetical protein